MCNKESLIYDKAYPSYLVTDEKATEFMKSKGLEGRKLLRKETLTLGELKIEVYLDDSIPSEII